VNRSRVALYEFMPYGAPELLEVGESHLTRALTTSSTSLCVLFALALGLSALAPHRAGPAPSSVIVDHFFLPPPPLDVPLIPRVPELQPAPPLHGVVPEPVRDEIALPDASIPTQEQLSQQGQSERPLDGQSIAPPSVEKPPSLDEFRLYDESPGVVTAVKPAYPDLAREAGVEGTVRLRVLVGTDGRVHDVHVDASVPLLDEAAVAAAGQWVFTPALANGHAVMVWIAIPIRFSLH
jgi:protein TonB